jgi:hypothetical protein
MTQRAPISFASKGASFLQRMKAALGSEMAIYSAQRFVQALITLVLASALCFAVIQLSPTNYLDTPKAIRVRPSAD